MCGAAAWALSASRLSHFSTTTKVSGPYLVWTGSAGSASTAAPYSMQPFSARTAGTLARKCLSTSSRFPGFAVITAMTWITEPPKGWKQNRRDYRIFRSDDGAWRRNHRSGAADPRDGGDF